MRIVTIDASRIRDKKGSHEYLKEVFGFPEYYGNNLDALHDCLTDIKDLRIFITNADHAGAYFLKLYPILIKDGKAMLL